MVNSFKKQRQDCPGDLNGERLILDCKQQQRSSLQELEKSPYLFQIHSFWQRMLIKFQKPQKGSRSSSPVFVDNREAEEATP